MKQASFLIACMLAGGLAGAARAGSGRPAEAVLVSAPAGEVREIIDGRMWRCLGTGCRGNSASAPKSQPVLSECRSVAARLGALSAYRSGKHRLNAEQLAQCNAAARPGVSAGL